MFEGFKYRVAKNHVLLALEQKGLISSGEHEHMKTVSYNKNNKEYGIEALRSGACADKYSAAAAVFARLSIVADRAGSSTNLSSEQWDMACSEAMLNAGAEPYEVEDIVEGLKDMLRDSV